MNKPTDLTTPSTPTKTITIPRPFPKPVVELERPHRTVTDSSEGDDATPLLQVRVGDFWCVFIRFAHEKRNPKAPPRLDGGVPLLDDMTGIRQWE